MVFRGFRVGDGREVLKITIIQGHMGVSENRGTLFGDPFHGILFFWGYRRVSPLFSHIIRRCTFILRTPPNCRPLLALLLTGSSL